MKAAFKKSIHSLSKHSHYILGISIQSQNSSGERLKGIVECLNKSNLQKGIIDVSDTLARHTYKIAGMKSGDAYSRAINAGHEWVKTNKSILSGLKSAFSIVHWDHWLSDSRFGSYKQKFDQASNDNSSLKLAIEKDIQNFYSRKFNIVASNIPKEHINISKEFYAEELAVMSIQFEDYPGAQIYPGKELECLKIVRSGQVSDVPHGIEGAEFFRIVFSP